jgi:hypothetical protein
LANQLQILDRWNNREILPQDIGGELRPLIYSAIVERIEWDTEMLLQGSFAASDSKYFKRRNLIFYSPKVTRETISGVKLSFLLILTILMSFEKARSPSKAFYNTTITSIGTSPMAIATFAPTPNNWKNGVNMF